MRNATLALALGAFLLCPAGSSEAAAQTADSAAFIIRLGDDTTVVERSVRTPQRWVAEAVQRSPRTMVHRLVMDLAPGGAVTGAEWTVREPGSDDVTLRRVIEVDGDSAVIHTMQGGATRTMRAPVRDAVVMAGPFYTPYEAVLVRAAAADADSTSVQLLSGGATVDIPVRRLDGGEVELANQFGEPMTARVDARGRLMGLRTPGYTTVERLPWVDLDALTREFVARDETGRGMGPLSPRMTDRYSMHDATIWLDYSSPGARGRPIWGGLVPWDEVWRMGANDAAHLATDHTLALGSAGELTLEPGAYTLFLIPTEGAWTLVINRATGISGLARDPALDVGRVAMDVERLQEPVEGFTMSVERTQEGGRLALAWADRRASVPFTFR